MLPIAAVASPTSTARLADLIAAHEAAVNALRDADNACEELADIRESRVSFLGGELSIGDRARRQLTQGVELSCQLEINRLDMISRLSPELGEAARAMLEKSKADCLAQIEAAYADHDAAASAVREAEKVCHEAVLALCGHRCASPEELAIKLRYLTTDGGAGLEEDQANAFYKSLLPEGEEIGAV
jgi:hypothetical protein